MPWLQVTRGSSHCWKLPKQQAHGDPHKLFRRIADCWSNVVHSCCARVTPVHSRRKMRHALTLFATLWDVPFRTKILAQNLIQPWATGKRCTDCTRLQGKPTANQPKRKAANSCSEFPAQERDLYGQSICPHSVNPHGVHEGLKLHYFGCGNSDENQPGSSPNRPSCSK